MTNRPATRRSARRRATAPAPSYPAIDYSPAHGSSPARSGRWATPLQRRTARPSCGAIRLNAESGPESNHLGKLSIVLMLAAGAFLATTTSIGMTDRRPVTDAQPESVAAPRFFFGDAEDAIDQRLLEHELRHAEPLPKVKDESDPEDAPSDPDAPDTSDLAEPDTRTLAYVPDEVKRPLPHDAKTSTMTGVPRSVDSNRPGSDANEESVTRLQVATGDTLSVILHRHGLRGEPLHSVLTDPLVELELSRLRVGQELEITQDDEGRFVGLQARVSKDRRITLESRPGVEGIVAAAIDLPVEKERVVTSGTIEDSLYLSAKRAELGQSTIMAMADIFQWEVDFARDTRAGDQFSILYDRLYREGQYIGDGDILAAEFIRGGRAYRAIRYTREDGSSAYYSPDGKSKRRTFLRHPVDVVRITSHFDPNRLHPVLHQIRAHRGVDYGAPYGSPIRATADGVIARAGPYGAYGNTVIVEHGTRTSTLYAHMSKLSDNARSGQRVRQGDVIGYVGNSGRVTGTHLHYEYRVNGEHVDPLTVELPAAAPLPSQYMDDFEAQSEQISIQMRSVSPTASSGTRSGSTQRVAAASDELQSAIPAR